MVSLLEENVSDFGSFDNGPRAAVLEGLSQKKAMLRARVPQAL